MLKEGTSGGIPHVIAAPLAILGLSGERVFPRMTLPILSIGKPERSIDALITGATRLMGANVLKIPPKSPIADRTALTTKTLRFMNTSCKVLRELYTQHIQIGISFLHAL
jgi:hypothetical protein